MEELEKLEEMLDAVLAEDASDSSSAKTSDSSGRHHHEHSHHEHHHHHSGHHSGHHGSHHNSENKSAIPKAESQEKKKEKKQKEVKKNKNNKKNTKLIIIIVILILLLALATAAVYLLKTYKDVTNAAASGNIDQITTSQYSDEELGIDPTVAKQLDGYRNIVIYGLDNTKRSDVILVISIDKETKKGKLWTVYRDTYMQLNPDKVYSFSNGDNDFFKCNHSYKKGGKITSIQMLNRHLDLNIRECVGFDWDAVSTLVDKIDGIDVAIDPTLCDFINAHIAADNKIVMIDGTAHLNGEQAVAYLRTRKDPGSTAATRSMRNLQVFLDLFERAKGMEKEELLDIFTKMIGRVETNMNIPTMMALLKDIRSYELEPQEGWPYEYSILWDDAFYYYVPETLSENVSSLHYTLFEQSDYEPSKTCNKLSKKIVEKHDILN